MLAWIRRQPCLLAARTRCDLFFSQAEADHVKTRGAGGKEAQNLVPLCRKHHQLKHDVGIRSFERGYGIDLKQLAVEYHQRYQREAA